MIIYFLLLQVLKKKSYVLTSDWGGGGGNDTLYWKLEDHSTSVYGVRKRNCNKNLHFVENSLNSTSV